MMKAVRIIWLSFGCVCVCAHTIKSILFFISLLYTLFSTLYSSLTKSPPSLAFIGNSFIVNETNWQTVRCNSCPFVRSFWFVLNKTICLRYLWFIKWFISFVFIQPAHVGRRHSHNIKPASKLPASLLPVPYGFSSFFWQLNVRSTDWLRWSDISAFA